MSEFNEAVAFSQSLDALHIPHWHIPNETSIHNWGYLMKMRQCGKKAGIADYLIFIPSDKSYVGRALLLFIELKKPRKQLKRKSVRGEKGDMVSQNDASLEQVEFLDMMNQVKDVQGYVCHGCDEALSVVRKFLA